MIPKPSLSHVVMSPRVHEHWPSYDTTRRGFLTRDRRRAGILAALAFVLLVLAVHGKISLSSEQGIVASASLYSSVFDDFF